MKLEELEDEFEDGPEEEEENDLEQSLTDALSLMEDCQAVLLTVVAQKMPLALRGEILRVTEEVNVFLSEYEIEEVAKEDCCDGVAPQGVENIYECYGGEV